MTGLRKFDELMEKLEIIINEMMGRRLSSTDGSGECRYTRCENDTE